VHLGTDVADAFLDLPDALAGAATAPEEVDVAGIALGVIGSIPG